MSTKVLVTGASGGIGSAIARKLAQNGYDLLLHYSRSKEKAEQIARDIHHLGQAAALVKADLTTAAGVKEVIAKAGEAEVLVFAAGTSQFGLIQDVTEKEIDQLWNLHMKAPMLLTRALMPQLLRKPNASILFVSSIWGETGASCETVYSAVKGAQISFSKALAKEVGPSGVRVNVISPGFVQTSMNSLYLPEEKKAIAEEIPLGRLALPEEIAGSAAFLISPAASYITGHVLSVNGGWHM